MPVMQYKPLYTAKEAAKLLQVSIGKVYEMMNRGELPYLYLGTKKIRGSDLEKFIEGYPAEKAEGGAG